MLKSGGRSYLVVVGEHPRDDQKNGVTMIFDLSKQVWYEASARPEVGNHHASEVINNKLYLFGGLSGGEGDIQIGTLKDTGTGIDITWKKGAGLPFDGGSASSALIGGKVSSVLMLFPGMPQCSAYQAEFNAMPAHTGAVRHVLICSQGTSLKHSISVRMALFCLTGAHVPSWCGQCRFTTVAESTRVTPRL